MSSESLTFRGQTGQIAAIGYGRTDRPKVLALHGWLDNAASFQPLAEQLDDLYVVAMDFAGHGCSQRRPEGSAYHMTDYIFDVAHVVESLEWDQFTLMGHSLGAGASILYAALFPERVSQLVMIDGLGPATESAESAKNRMRRAVEASLNHSARTAQKPKIYSNWDKLVSARTLASPLSDESAQILLQRGTTEVDGGVVVNADPRLKHPSAIYMSEEVVQEMIGQIACPSLLVLAESSMVASRSMTQPRMEKFQDLQTVRLPGKHHLHMDNPRPVADAIQRFLKECRS